VLVAERGRPAIDRVHRIVRVQIWRTTRHDTTRHDTTRHDTTRHTGERSWNATSARKKGT
jgi:hypothetical protein